MDPMITAFLLAFAGVIEDVDRARIETRRQIGDRSPDSSHGSKMAGKDQSKLAKPNLLIDQKVAQPVKVNCLRTAI